ncbi:CRISPR-associated protein [Aphanothece hegewaldii CCALA 016]|uniref:CRISPR-associated protein n=1 Tax=Aphanothece hegewaldii CCALA 016 TaxID=2107694 RepID=A0A2T1LYF9_9CHRO|nr:RAMP superfamily CRISPR-associated protein [Aphanothece hegewaldii]PSF37387.1 CRISPR-associated protein [Aphanothece hegewaldii CCALA 016]
MHKRLVNHCTIDLTLIPDGPILIKSGRQGADPTKPDMEFVETYYRGKRTIYLPGSSLKGAIRAHAERIVRTVGQENPNNKNPNIPWASNPLKDQRDHWKKKNSVEIYKLSSFTEQMFGNTSIASRVRIEDAYPVDVTSLNIEERNGVAIDRVFGSVAVGPFNYQVCTSGEFQTKIHLKNFTLAQLGLIGLVLRDLNDGWFGLGFAKSRGLGTVKVQYNSAVVQYPGCEVKNKQIYSFASQQPLGSHTALLGVGEFLIDNEYNFPKPDSHKETPVAFEPMELGFGIQQTWTGEEPVKCLFRKAVQSWSLVLRGGTAA